MELFVIILRWGISIFCALAGVVFGFDAIHSGISDIRQHIKGSCNFYNDTFGAIMGIILGLALFFIMGMAFIYANPLVASLCGLN